MTSFVRRAAIFTTTLAVVAAGGVGLAAAAQAATDPSAAATAAATATPSAAATSAATASPSASTTAAPTATASPSATSGSSSGAGGSSATAGQDPSLAVQNANGNHAMGSTIPADDSASGATSLKLHSLATVQATAQAATPSGLKGLDVSAYQPSVNWSSVAANGAKFAYIKATEGTTYTSSTFASQYNGAYAAGLSRGAYVFATPNTSTGAAQATYFVNHGGNWTNDGRTLPPLLDIEYGYNATCWGLSQAAMVAWIKDFSNTVLKLTGIRPAIYSTTDWWSQCTGNNSGFSQNPLFIAHYTTASTPGTLPASWKSWSVWQWADSGVFPGDQDVFNGTIGQLKYFALGTTASSVPVAGATASSTLAAGAKLTAGKSMTSSNGQFTLSMQSDGNLVLSGNGHVMWYSHTSGSGAYLTMQADGNLVIYSATGTALWKTSTTGTGGTMVLSSSGQLQVTTSNGQVWTSGWTGTSYISKGTNLVAGQTIHDVSGLVQGIMQSDGNFVVYINRKAKWQSGTGGNPGSRLDLQSDGNLVLYNSAGRAIWTSRSTGANPILQTQTDGNMVLTAGGKVKWYSRTSV
ncbi:GH25 family lysozyme [Frondihabitans australicus]|uniref:lysozyme n=1 Tax=Frondihabitans australicus TaxID=386892 RepID=A0A495IKV1_9MICO|nr:GH25 family lysozyme [Frondihabitans australicus]RKR76607.1 GH25 family lysozyme M1 (1,4-beta-N-acetylmuramidase) [Frondihabitans australicus]